jgi:alkaline phosphatase
MEHTGSQVRLAAFGPGAEQFSGHHDMTEVFDLIRKALDLK